jgi:hypothetical protein
VSYKTSAHEIVAVEVAEVPSPLHSHLAGISKKNTCYRMSPFDLLPNQFKVEPTTPTNLRLPPESKLLVQRPHQCLLQPTIC